MKDKSTLIHAVWQRKPAGAHVSRGRAHQINRHRGEEKPFANKEAGAEMGREMAVITPVELAQAHGLPHMQVNSDINVCKEQCLSPWKETRSGTHEKQTQTPAGDSHWNNHENNGS